MRMYAIANVDCIDCYYDFELNTWGDGLCKANLLPSESLAEELIDIYELYDGQVIEVHVVDVFRENDADYNPEDDSNQIIGYINEWIWEEEPPIEDNLK